MGRFDFIPTPLEGLLTVRRKPLGDKRGFFSRFYCADEFRPMGWNRPIAQINHTFTKRRGAVRGLHFQYPPKAEAKLVSCLRGEVFDVAVDLRKGSHTFLRWHGEVLSAVNHKSLLIPEGFAHGFQALTDDCELLYLHTEFYSPDFEGALHTADPRLAIAWPLAVTELSERDRGHSMLEDSYEGLIL
jgi:dTDP-4-dehydrorhamnose 3,5-epimerase